MIINFDKERVICAAAGAVIGGLAVCIHNQFKREKSKSDGFGPQFENLNAPLITDALLTPGASHGRTGQRLDPNGAVIHYVANPGSSAMGNRNYFENGSNGNGASAHYIVGLNGEILRMIPENERAMHAGRSYGAQWQEQAKVNNATLLGIEVCHPDSSGKFSAVTYKSLIALTADICARRGFDPSKAVFRHYDVTGKLCPVYYVNNPSAWTQMRTDIKNAMTSAPPTGPSDWAKAAWEWGIASGVTDGSRPRDNAKREEALAMIYRAVRSRDIEDMSLDSPEIDVY